MAFALESELALNSGPAISILPRQGNSPDLIDPVTMPWCNASACWYRKYDPPDLCPLVDGPCPDNKDASDNGGTKCGMKQYERECYCNLKTGLVCAWSCPWDLWWETEDWFAKLCPDSPALKVDYSGLPDCARDCLDDATFSYGCITQSVNCFCADGNLHDCHNSCSSDEEWAQIEEWLQNTCDMDADEARVALAEGTFTIAAEGKPTSTSAPGPRDFGPPPPKPREPLSWDEIFMLVVVGVTLLSSIIFGIQDRVARKSKSGE